MSRPTRLPTRRVAVFETLTELEHRTNSGAATDFEAYGCAGSWAFCPGRLLLTFLTDRPDARMDLHALYGFTRGQGVVAVRASVLEV